MTKAFKTAVIAALAFSSIDAIAQNGVNSPYSRSGFGLLSDRSMGFNKGMGGIAQGYRSGQAINTANPASLSSCDSLTALFDIGMSLQNGNYKMGNLQQNARNTSLDYFSFGFRAYRGLGMAVSMLPVSNIGYSYSSLSESIPEYEDVTSNYNINGSGGLHQVMFSIGWQLAKPISIGANISYLYGDYNHTSNVAFNPTTVSSITRNYTADISTYSIDLSTQYTQKISDKDFIVFGATYGLGHDINNEAYRTTSTLNTSNGVNKATTDTIKNAFQLPATISAGFTYHHSYKFLAGADFELQKWGKVKFPNNQSSSVYESTVGQFNDRMKISAGLSWTPDPLSNKYTNRMSYKVGGFYSKSYANVEGISLSDKPYEFGLTAGLAFPISNSNTNGATPKLNLSFQWIHSNIPYTSTSSNIQNKLTENYLKVCLGITFSDRWFYKWKVK